MDLFATKPPAIKAECTPPREGPREPVRVFGPRTMWFPDLSDAIEYAGLRGWNGSRIYGMRCGKLLAVIVPMPDYSTAEHSVLEIDADAA